MDQDSRSSESRERAVSSEPSSTRPNPFDDGDLAARKRRRTSLSGSRSSSVETLMSQDETIAASDANIMKVDTPEPAPPSTPARSEPPAEPVSSKVTINLRNADSLEATPASPTSPTPARARPDDVKVSVEKSEVNMTQPSHNTDPDAPSSPSEIDSPGDSVVALNDVDNDLEIYAAEPQMSLLGDGRAAQFSAAMLDFPYHGDGESYHDTVARLINYFRQQPSHVDEALQSINEWMEQYLACADIGLSVLVIQAYQLHRPFWQSLPDLLYTIFQKHGLTKSRETRNLAGHLCSLVGRLTAFFLTVDCQTLKHVNASADGELDLISPAYIRFFGTVTLRDENYQSNGYGSGNGADLLEPLEIFQSCPGGSFVFLTRFMQLHMNVLSRSPKKVMEHFSSCCVLMHALTRDSVRKLSFPAGIPANVIERSTKNLLLGNQCFKLVTSALDAVVDKSINHLSNDNAAIIMYHLAEVIKYCLHGSHAEAIALVHAHREEHPNLSHQFTVDAIMYEWRFDLFSKLARSRQMQLRVLAVTVMCEDLINLWSQYRDRQELMEDPLNLVYLRYLSGYVMHTGIVDYILGPTCHPEITQVSFNIVGFLGVTKTYTGAQTDLLWQTITSTQDPRISEALVRMIERVLHLLDSESNLPYFLEKLHGVSIDSFTSVMRELFDKVTKVFLTRYQQIPVTAYTLLLRLLRESSVYGTHGSTAYPDIQKFALTKFKDLLPSGPSHDVRLDISMSCLQDIAARSPTTSGSLQVLNMLMGNAHGIQTLVAEHDLTRLLVDELESSIGSARLVGFSPVYANHINQARRKFISNVITYHGRTIDSDLGGRLWDLLVGGGAVCPEDRAVAWEDLNAALSQTRLDNPFLNACLREYLPKLPPSCFCTGSLSFVRDAVVPVANDVNGIVLDDEESLKSTGIELLWQMILTAPSQTIEGNAIITLVNEVYVDSKTILSYPLHRARRVHFALVQRCLHQLKSAAQRLRAFNNGTASGDGEQMVIVATGAEHYQQELQFTRSLQVLITLLRTLQARSHFAAPDLRSLMLQTPSAVDGDPADVKYQSFDGDQQTEVRPLEIGLKNSAASLLASIREATGFDNYRLYYRGQPLTPSDTDICKSLEDLDIRNGLILVKKESDIASSPLRIKPGASPLDIEILSHFKDLWGYLSMEEKLAREIYHFLISLPADDSILTAFENPGTTHLDIFPLGQPFKCLYAIHALREYLSTRRLRSSVMQTSAQDSEHRHKTATDQEDALVKAMTLIISAICDPEVVGRCSGEALKLQLSLQLVDNFVQLLKETMDVAAIGPFLTSELYARLLSIIESAATVETTQVSLDLVHRSFEALLESCAKSHKFWTMFRDQPAVREVTQTLLLDDERPLVRKGIAKLIGTKCFYNHGPSGVLATDFAELFWPMVSELLPRAVYEPRKCEEVFTLCFQLMKKLIEANSNALDLPVCLAECGQLLLSLTTTEDIAHPEKIDMVAHGLITILYHGIKQMFAKGEQVRFVPGFASKLFSRHLFPREDERGPLVPQVILNTASRSMLYEIVFYLVKDDPSQSLKLLADLDTLTSHRDTHDGDKEYKYDLTQSFDRMNAIRSPCGYAGLRNLSNTCYLNSLFTQLFMNVEFRRFILGARGGDPATHQLLHETKNLFASLQDSRRKYIDPHECVDQIMTYEELPIDIHNQMDVDEFYSLLFDRWESQMSSESDKKALKAIYGGQLVQQVKSKECEHISERIEPFSAIQCDIKGKASLEESLQAYVDGEIMEGDNKYKCSDCDRFVDAVKRACLKDVPDNLIFHLKRFDFNLQTLQRSKINDYFTFPSKIDMQPYTVEHLSDPSHKTEPDEFELVGVLVHSGTAESGHYYSYIRERPSTDSTQSWVEFNDEAVTSWDPVQMENACFGGPDYRPQFETGGAYEKAYSAYMLFYQRSSSLAKGQEILKASGSPVPLRSDLPTDLELQVKGDNWAIVQRHCLYDPTHIPFVQKVLSMAWATKCSEEHRTENLAMHVMLGHLDQVASRAKDLPDYDPLKNLLVKVCQRCPHCCYAFFDYFRRFKEPFRMLLLKNADPSVRYDIGQTLILVLNSIKRAFPEEYGMDYQGEKRRGAAREEYFVIEETVQLFLHALETFHQRLPAWPEYFGTVLDFVDLGHREASWLLAKDFFARILLIIVADQSLDLPPQYARLFAVVSRRMATRPPNYENIIALIDTLMGYTDPDLGNSVENSHDRLEPALRREPAPCTSYEVNIFTREWPRTQVTMFTDKLIQLNQNPIATDNIIRRMMGCGSILDDSIYSTLRAGITGQFAPQAVSPYLRAAVTYCQYSVNVEHVHRLISHVSSLCRNVQNAEGRSFFEFQRDVFEKQRATGESNEVIQLHLLENLPLWVPGLLGYLDHTVGRDVDDYMQDKLFKYGPSPVFSENDGGSTRSQAMNSAARRLAINCLIYLRDTYVVRAAQAARDTVIPLDRTVKQCEPYFKVDEEYNVELVATFAELCESVMESMDRLIVDEVEEDGSDWEQSIGSSEPMDSVADLSMQVDTEGAL